jgi:hypothetical protein
MKKYMHVAEPGIISQRPEREESRCGSAAHAVEYGRARLCVADNVWCLR